MKRNLIPLYLLVSFFLGLSQANGEDKFKSKVVPGDPVIKVFEKHHIKLYKASNAYGENCMEYYIELPADPVVSGSELYPLYIEVLLANKNRSYSLVSELDKIRVNISWEKKDAKDILNEDIDGIEDAPRCAKK